MAMFSHAIGKESDIHIVSVFVFALIRESHDTVQVSLGTLIFTIKYTCQRSTAAVTLHKDLRTFRQSGKVVGADGVEYVVPVQYVAGVG